MAAPGQPLVVLLTSGAEQDLEAIYDYVAEFDSVENANDLLDALIQEAQALASFPERGSYPKELLRLGIKDFRQTFFRSYRLVYRVLDAQVVVYLIVDGRREMQSVLSRRLLGA